MIQASSRAAVLFRGAIFETQVGHRLDVPEPRPVIDQPDQFLGVEFVRDKLPQPPHSGDAEVVEREDELMLRLDIAIAQLLHVPSKLLIRCESIPA